MNARITTSFENIEKERWNALASQNKTNTIFQTFEWNYSWWKVFGADKELFLVCVEDKNNLKGLAPLMICIDRRGKRVLRFIGHGRADYADLIYHDEEVLSIIFNIIKLQSSRWEEIEFDRIPDYSEFSGLAGRICRTNRLYCLKGKTTMCSALDFVKDPDFVQQVLNKKKLMQYKKYFLKIGGYEVKHLTCKSEIIHCLEGFFRQHIDRWSATETPSLFNEQDNRDFYKELMFNIADNGWLLFSTVESKGMPIAFHFGFTYNNKLIFYKPSFEISMFKHSPGQVLLKELLDFAAANNFNEFDFTVGDETYKKRFSNKFGTTISYIIFKNYPTYLFNKTMRIIKTTMDKYRHWNSISVFGR